MIRVRSCFQFWPITGDEGDKTGEAKPVVFRKLSPSEPIMRAIIWKFSGNNKYVIRKEAATYLISVAATMWYGKFLGEK